MSDAVCALREFVAHSKDVTSVALCRHNVQLLASGGKDCKINLWRLDIANCQMTMSGYDSAVESLAFHPLSSKLCGGSAKGVVKVWDLQSAILTHNFTNHKKSIRSIGFHAFGEFLVTGSADCTVKLWDLKRKGCIMTYKGHEHPVTIVKFSPDGRWLASADEGGILKVWDMSNHHLLHQFDGHKNGITALDFHPAELLMASTSLDNTVKIWDLDEMNLLGTIEVQQPKAILFDTMGNHMYCIGEKDLHICGWEPAISHISLKLKQAGTCHAVFLDDNLMGVAYEQNKVSAYSVDLKRALMNYNLEKSSLHKNRKTFVGPILEITSKQTDGNKSVTENIRSDIEVKDKEFWHFISSNEVEESADQLNPDLKILNEVRNSHKSVLALLSKKQSNLQEIKKEWNSRGVKSAVSLAIDKQDDSVIVDLLHVLLSDVRLWDLDACLLLLPPLMKLLQSNVEKHVHISLSTLRLIGHRFGPEIKTNIIASPYPNENEFARQDKYFKSKSCFKHLLQIHYFLKRKKTVITQGRLGEKILEMYELIGRTVS